MTTHRITLTMGAVPEIYARVYRSRGMKVPVMRSPNHRGALITATEDTWKPAPSNATPDHTTAS